MLWSVHVHAFIARDEVTGIQSLNQKLSPIKVPPWIAVVCVDLQEATPPLAAGGALSAQVH